MLAIQNVQNARSIVFLHSAKIHEMSVCEDFRVKPLLLSSTKVCIIVLFSSQQVFKRVSSGIAWVLVYRTEKYKKLKTEVEKQSKKRKFLIHQGFILVFLCYNLILLF